MENEAIEIVQLAIDTVGVVSTTVIAVVGAKIAYRTAYGSRQILFISKKGVSHPNERTKYKTLFNSEIYLWNNRRYPVKLSNTYLTVHGMDFLGENVFGTVFDEKWQIVSKNTLIRLPTDDIISEGSHIMLPVSAAIKDFVHGFNYRIDCKVSIFDPISARYETIRVRDTLCLGKFPSS